MTFNFVGTQVERLLQQTTDSILMVRPDDFSFNEETAVDNEFQQRVNLSKEEINARALQEFEASVQILKSHGVNVITVGKSQFAKKNNFSVPDAVFPNNWVSFHRDGTIINYPMCAPNRRVETKSIDEVKELLRQNNFYMKEQVLYLIDPEEEDKNEHSDFLESTGVLIFDHVNKTIYCALSQRASRNSIEKLRELTDDQYFDKMVLFNTKSSNGKGFYHSNVMMSIGDSFAVICSESIIDDEINTRENVIKQLRESQREVIEITFEQTEKYFCGNIIQLRSTNERNEPTGLIVMSQSAFAKGFTDEQKQVLNKFGSLVPLPVDETIEKIGGGSARCMICEIFLPKLEEQ